MSRHGNHPPCACGCGELADECAGPRPNPFGSMRVQRPEPNPYSAAGLQRMSKSALVKLYRAGGGMGGMHPPEKWSKDDLVSSVLSMQRRKTEASS